MARAERESGHNLTQQSCRRIYTIYSKMKRIDTQYELRAVSSPLTQYIQIDSNASQSPTLMASVEWKRARRSGRDAQVQVQYVRIIDQ